MRTIVVLGAVAVLAACNSSNDGSIAGPVGPGPGPGPGPVPEVGVFGFNVGEPVGIRTATRGGDGVVIGEFQVTFNNKDGTDFTITTPEGEEITFTEDDLEFVGQDRFLVNRLDEPFGGLEIARLTNPDGNKLDIVLAGDHVTVPFQAAIPGVPAGCEQNPPCTTEPISEVQEETADSYAVARLDEHDTRTGFETYVVVGLETLPEILARHSGNFEEITDGVCTARCGGDLVEGTAEYNGKFVASLFAYGLGVTDDIVGDSKTTLDFAGSTVDILLNNSNRFDVFLTGQGTAQDFNFSTGYEGLLDGTLELPDNVTGIIGTTGTGLGEKIGTSNTSTTIFVGGEFGGALYGPNAEHTAGVFLTNEANFNEIVTLATRIDPAVIRSVDIPVDVVGGYDGALDNNGLPSEPIPVPGP